MSNDKKMDALETCRNPETLDDLAKEVRQALEKRELKASLKLLYNAYAIILVPTDEATKEEIAALEQLAEGYLVTYKSLHIGELSMGRCIFVDTDPKT